MIKEMDRVHCAMLHVQQVFIGIDIHLMSVYQRMTQPNPWTPSTYDVDSGWNSPGRGHHGFSGQREPDLNPSFSPTLG